MFVRQNLPLVDSGTPSVDSEEDDVEPPKQMQPLFGSSDTTAVNSRHHSGSSNTTAVAPWRHTASNSNTTSIASWRTASNSNTTAEASRYAATNSNTTAEAPRYTATNSNTTAEAFRYAASNSNTTSRNCNTTAVGWRQSNTDPHLRINGFSSLQPCSLDEMARAQFEPSTSESINFDTMDTDDGSDSDSDGSFSSFSESEGVIPTESDTD